MAGLPSGSDAGISVLDLHLQHGAADPTAVSRVVCERRGCGSYCDIGQSVSWHNGIFLHLSGFYQWIPGVLPWHGYDEDDSSGHLYSDLSACDRHLDSGAAVWNLRSILCLCDRLERDADGRDSVLFCGAEKGMKRYVNVV